MLNLIYLFKFWTSGGWSILCCGQPLEIETFYLRTDQQTSHLDGHSGKHGSDPQAYQVFFTCLTWFHHFSYHPHG